MGTDLGGRIDAVLEQYLDDEQELEEVSSVHCYSSLCKECGRLVSASSWVPGQYLDHEQKTERVAFLQSSGV